MLHLHQWIFLKAANTSRNGAPAARKKSEKDKSAEAAVVGEKHAASASPSPQPLRKTKKTKTQKSRPVTAPRSEIQSSASTEYLLDSFTADSDEERRIHLAGHLVKYLFSKPDTMGGPELLTLLHDHWTENAAFYEKSLTTFYPAADHILNVWIAERRSIIEFEESIPEDLSTQDRFLAANNLRLQRSQWKHFSFEHEGETLDAADVLCRTFAMITDSTGQATLKMFRRGLEEVNRELEDLDGGNVLIVLH